MLKILFVTVLILTSINAIDDSTIVRTHNIQVKYNLPNGKIKQTVIARESYEDCARITFDAREFWGGNYASRDVSDHCKATYIKTAGKISPMKIHKDIMTFGELEVLAYIKKMQNDKMMLFIDSRKPNWYKRSTIPSAINIPYTYFTNPKYEKYKEDALRYFGVKKTDTGYDFTHARTILFFCNGIWCGQSPEMIHALLSLGYPATKMKWYRGGLQNWTSVGLTTTSTAR
jgi:rhodanese-related sulfurtransferase